jgi:predicted transcriptional regulator
MEKVDTFLILYNKLDEYLRRHAEQTKRDLPFGQRLDNLAGKHSVLRQNAAKLKDYGDLRNAIIHHRDPSGGIIAVPTERTLQEFERIVQAILSPPKLIPRFKSDIHLFSPPDPLVTALQHMREHNYSQVVVKTEGKLSLLTVEGIARWLEEQAQDDIISVRDAHIADAQKYEQVENVSIMNRNQTVYEAMDTFMLAIEQKRPRIYALLITEHGKLIESPLGIVTPWDLLSIANL